jgi:hypothetical protein
MQYVIEMLKMKTSIILCVFKNWIMEWVQDKVDQFCVKLQVFAKCHALTCYKIIIMPNLLLN